MFLDRRLEVHGLPDIERQSERLIVLAPDVDRVFVANDVDASRFDRETDRVRERSKTVLDLCIGPELGEARFLSHRVAKTIVIEQILSGVHPEVDDRHKNDELDHAAKPARTPPWTC